MKNTLFKKFSFLWVTMIFFLVSITGHWIAAWYAYQNEQRAHNQPVEVNEYLVEILRDTLENWQSEFLQLIWQVGGLAFLLYVGSPQSKEGDERKEEKIDEILRLLGGKKAKAFISEVNKKYPTK